MTSAHDKQPPLRAAAAATLIAAVAFAGCAAGGSGRRLGWSVKDDAAAGWTQLVAGDEAAAERAFAARAARLPGDATARFGLFVRAWDRGDSDEALTQALALLGTARSTTDPWAPLLAGAAATRLPVLSDESLTVDRKAAVDAALAALPGLPWQGQIAVATWADEEARRAGDAAGLVRGATAAGCAQGLINHGRVGRLPLLDLTREATLDAGKAISGAGCRVQIPVAEPLPGVIAVTWPVDVSAQDGGTWEVALDVAARAALRVDDQPFAQHGSEAQFGPRQSRHSVRMAPGHHRIELRLSTYGADVTVTLMARPPRSSGPPVEPLQAPRDAIAATLFAYAQALLANATGDASQSAALQGTLRARQSFASGLALAAEAAEQDPSRAAAMARDAGRRLAEGAARADVRAVRPRLSLALSLLGQDLPRDAAERADEILQINPRFWPAALLAYRAYEAYGFDRDADEHLERALAIVRRAQSPRACGVWRAALARAQRRHVRDDEVRLVAQVAACDARSSEAADWFLRQGRWDEASAQLRRQDGVIPGGDRDEQAAQIALARGDASAAAAALGRAVAAQPRDLGLRVRLADAFAAAGRDGDARRILTQALAADVGRAEVRDAARARGIPLPLDAWRVDGEAVIRAFEASGRHWDAPAVMVLDRTVERVMDDGARVVLTHNIVRVQTKDGIERWAEVPVSAGGEVLTLRTRKADGRTREPEDIFGKTTVSAPDLEVGDYVEWEVVDYEEPSAAFAPGFLSQRFYFQTFDAPLDTSEYLLLTSARQPDLQIDTRAGAPAPVVRHLPEGLVLRQWQAHHMPQVFAERAAVPPVEWLPSVRVAAGVSAEGWRRFVADRLAALLRESAELRAIADALGDRARTPEARAAALVRWVTETIEAESGFDEPAAFAVATTRGNRLVVALALARLLGLRAEPVLVRSRTVADASAPLVPAEIDDFGELVLHFPDLHRFSDLRLRHAPFGYVPPALDGAPGLGIDEPQLLRVTSAVPDARRVGVAARLAPDGRATVRVVEELSGWPALEWAELIERAGQDTRKLRQEFEERWLGQQFPGAELRELRPELRDSGERGVRVEYVFVSPRWASRDGADLTMTPTFFRAQPGRRFASEAQRRTPLQLGFDVPTDVEASVELPVGARVLDAGVSEAVPITGAAGARFEERRSVVGLPAGPSRLLLHRRWSLPLARVAPGGYAGVAAQLRRVDPLEAGEIRIRTAPAAPTAGAAP